MGNSVSGYSDERIHKEIFAGVVPLRRCDIEASPRRHVCPDCGEPFLVEAVSRHCRICGECLCQSCCRPRRCWRWRAVCNFCVNVLSHSYFEGNVQYRGVRERSRRRKDRVLAFIRSFFVFW
ncbi:hypothetical protein TRVL_03612 [Trypanosoma vivax]|nr:hypothetical protein TRVL_03612 [Trypanosoma vivax]